MNLPKRKQIHLKNYDYSKKNAFYVTICTHHQSCMFGEIIGDQFRPYQHAPDRMIEKWLLEIERKFPCFMVTRYVIMPNHIHFVLFPAPEEDFEKGYDRPSLGSVIQWFKTQSTNEYIRNVKKGIYPPFDQHIWQRGYYEHIIRSEQDYIEICRYIDRNIAAWQYKH